MTGNGKASFTTWDRDTLNRDYTDARVDLNRFAFLVKTLYGNHPSVYAHLRSRYADTVL